MHQIYISFICHFYPIFTVTFSIGKFLEVVLMEAGMVPVSDFWEPKHMSLPPGWCNRAAHQHRRGHVPSPAAELPTSTAVVVAPPRHVNNIGLYYSLLLLPIWYRKIHPFDMGSLWQWVQWTFSYRFSHTTPLHSLYATTGYEVFLVLAEC